MAYVNKDVQKKPNAAPAAEVEPASKTAGMVKGASGIDEQIQMLSPGAKGGWNGDQGAEAQLGSVQMMSKGSSGASKAGGSASKSAPTTSPNSASVSASASSKAAPAAAPKPPTTSPTTASAGASQAAKKPA